MQHVEECVPAACDTNMPQRCPDTRRQHRSQRRVRGAVRGVCPVASTGPIVPGPPGPTRFQRRLMRQVAQSASFVLIVSYLLDPEYLMFGYRGCGRLRGPAITRTGGAVPSYIFVASGPVLRDNKGRGDKWRRNLGTLSCAVCWPYLFN